MTPCYIPTDLNYARRLNRANAMHGYPENIARRMKQILTLDLKIQAYLISDADVVSDGMRALESLRFKSGDLIISDRNTERMTGPTAMSGAQR